MASPCIQELLGAFLSMKMRGRGFGGGGQEKESICHVGGGGGEKICPSGSPNVIFSKPRDANR